MKNLGFLEAGVGQPLVFLHGMAANAHTFQPQLDFFSQDFRTISLDSPGYGQAPSLSECTFAHLANWLHQRLAELAIRQPILVGHSMGGMIVQSYLARYADPVRAVVLYGSSPAFGKPDGEWQQRFIRARLQPLDDGHSMAELAPQIVKGLVGANAAAEGIARAEAGVAATPAETFRTAVQTIVTFDERANLAQISCPCLCLVGEEDTNAPPAMVEKMAAKISGATFQCLPGLGHMAHLEDPATFNRVVSEFLTCVSPS